MKLIYTACGLFNQKSSWPCPWCHANQNNKYACDLGKGRDSTIASSCIGKKDHYGYKYPSLLSKIPFTHVIIDTLHLKMRVTDKLINLLVRELASIDHLKDGEIFSSRHTNLTLWHQFLARIGIETAVRPFNEDISACVTRNFTGDELMRILENSSFIKDFPNITKCALKDDLWKSFHSIVSGLAEATPANVESATSIWHTKFLACYTHRHETPYIHCFAKHLHQFCSRVGDITLFGQQGLEKSNDFLTSEVFRATNLHFDRNNSDVDILNNDNYLVQLLSRRLRMDYCCEFI